MLRAIGCDCGLTSATSLLGQRCSPAIRDRGECHAKSSAPVQQAADASDTTAQKSRLTAKKSRKKDLPCSIRDLLAIERSRTRGRPMCRHARLRGSLEPVAFEGRERQALVGLPVEAPLEKAPDLSVRADGEVAVCR